jgi:heptosyltransferase-3
MKEPNNILVIIVARIGDTLLATPTIRSLREQYPKARITVLAHPGRKEVLENLPFIDDLGKITKKTAPFKGRLPGKAFDLCILYSKDAALLAYARRVSKQVILFKNTKQKTLSDIVYVPTPKNETHAVDERLMLLDPLNIETRDLRIAYQITESEKEWALKWIKEVFGYFPKTLIGIQAMSFPTKPYRNWPLEHFSSLIEQLAIQHTDIAFILLGDKECREKTQGLDQDTETVIVNSCGNLTLRESAALMGQLSLYIGVDTGPTHIVGALETPMVAIYHCYHPGALLKPLQRENLEVIEHAEFSTHCTRETPISSVPVDTVYEACQRLLDQPVLDKEPNPS